MGWDGALVYYVCLYFCSFGCAFYTPCKEYNDASHEHRTSARTITNTRAKPLGKYEPGEDCPSRGPHAVTNPAGRKSMRRCRMQLQRPSTTDAGRRERTPFLPVRECACQPAATVPVSSSSVYIPECATRITGTCAGHLLRQEQDAPGKNNTAMDRAKTQGERRYPLS